MTETKKNLTPETDTKEISTPETNKWICPDWYPDWLKMMVKKSETDGPDTDKSYTAKKFKDGLNEKLAIACYIADSIANDHVTGVFFEAGSTLRVIAGASFACAAAKHLSLIAATNNLDISEDFLTGRFDPSGSDVTLHLTGGRHDRNHHALFGEIAATSLSNIFPESIIIGCSGFTFTEGIFYHGGSEEGLVKSALYSKEVDRRIIAMDYSKMGRRDMFLCKNDRQEAISGLCNRVREKTIIVTSAPPNPIGGSKKPAKDVLNWNQEIEYLEKKFDGKAGDVAKQNVGTIQKWLAEGCLEVVVVASLDKFPYYNAVKIFSSN